VENTSIGRGPRARARGAVLVDYLVVLGALGLVVCAALVYVAGPSLVRSYRAASRSAASPMP
jgi:hypothetical protein